MDDDRVNKKAKRTKKCIIKRCLMFDNYQESLEKTKNTKKSTKI